MCGYAKTARTSAKSIISWYSVARNLIRVLCQLWVVSVTPRVSVTCALHFLKCFALQVQASKEEKKSTQRRHRFPNKDARAFAHVWGSTGHCAHDKNNDKYTEINSPSVANFLSNGSTSSATALELRTATTSRFTWRLFRAALQKSVE